MVEEDVARHSKVLRNEEPIGLYMGGGGSPGLHAPPATSPPATQKGAGGSTIKGKKNRGKKK